MRQQSTRGHVRRSSQRILPGWFLGLVAFIGLLAVVLLMRSVFLELNEGDTTDYRHRTWLLDTWTQTEPSREDMETLVAQLNKHQIDRIYVATGAWRGDGNYREWPGARRYLELMRAIDDDIEVLIWLQVGEDQYPEQAIHTLLVNYTRQALNAWGYDGVHLQGFTVYNNSTSYVQLVRALDGVVDDEHILSITAPPDHLPSDPDVPIGPGNPSISWEPRYKQQLALLVDEMVVMAHTSGLESVEAYQQWVTYQVATYARDIARLGDIDTALVIAIPTYNVGVFHDPTIEGMASATAGIQAGLEAADGASERVTGVGVYIYDESNPADWDIFLREWVEK